MAVLVTNRAEKSAIIKRFQSYGNDSMAYSTDHFEQNKCEECCELQEGRLNFYESAKPHHNTTATVVKVEKRRGTNILILRCGPGGRTVIFLEFDSKRLTDEWQEALCRYTGQPYDPNPVLRRVRSELPAAANRWRRRAVTQSTFSDFVFEQVDSDAEQVDPPPESLEVALPAPSVTTPETPQEALLETPQEAPLEAPQEALLETPQEVPLEAPQEVPLEAHQEVPLESPLEAPLEAPQEVPLEAPQEAPLEAPQEVPLEAPQEAPLEAPQEAPQEAPLEVPLEAPQEVPLEAPQEAPLEAPQEAPQEAPLEAPLEAPQEAPLEAPQEVPLEAPQEVPLEAPQEAPLEPPQEAPLEVPQEVPLEAPQEVPLEAPQEVPLEAPQEVPLEAPQEVPLEAPLEVPLEAPQEVLLAPPVAPPSAPGSPIEEQVPSFTIETNETDDCDDAQNDSAPGSLRSRDDDSIPTLADLAKKSVEKEFTLSDLQKLKVKDCGGDVIVKELATPLWHLHVGDKIVLKNDGGLPMNAREMTKLIQTSPEPTIVLTVVRGTVCTAREEEHELVINIKGSQSVKLDTVDLILRALTSHCSLPYAEMPERSKLTITEINNIPVSIGSQPDQIAISMRAALDTSKGYLTIRLVPQSLLDALAEEDDDTHEEQARDILDE